MSLGAPAVERRRGGDEAGVGEDAGDSGSETSADCEPKFHTTEPEPNLFNTLSDARTKSAENLHVFAVAGVALMTGDKSVEAARAGSEELHAETWRPPGRGEIGLKDLWNSQQQRRKKH